jgi:putative tricarboxylic transport membrane protein
VPGIGEDIAAWVSYGTAKKASKHKERFGTGRKRESSLRKTPKFLYRWGNDPVAFDGIPGSPPAAMLLGALLLHGIARADAGSRAP